MKQRLGDWHLLGDWRLLTNGDFQQSLARADRDGASFGPGQHSDPDRPHIHLAAQAWDGCLRALGRHVSALPFEHGAESPIPRANTFRPYRLTIGSHLLAAIVLKASEAYGLSEVDVFLTGELPGIAPLESTRAALVFAICDSLRNGGSLAVQFTRKAAPTGLPAHVREAARLAQIPLARADQGTITPDESRELLLRWSGLDADDCERVRAMARRGFWSIERVGYLAARGIWPAHEVSLLLRNSPYPELLLGLGRSAMPRHLVAAVGDHGRTAVLAGILDRAVQQGQPVPDADGGVVESVMNRKLAAENIANELSVAYGPLPEDITLPGWQSHSTEPFGGRKGERHVFTLRPRNCESARRYIAHDVDGAATAAAKIASSSGVLVCSADLREMDEREIGEIHRYAHSRRVHVLTAPISCGDLDSELRGRLRLGRTVRP